MLVILLDNAIKYTPQGGAVSVYLEQHSGHATLTVEDTGVGIPEDARSQVFERFFRADPSRSKESGGHGLGLASQTIVNQHGASIELRPAPCGGSIFAVSLPSSHAGLNRTAKMILYGRATKGRKPWHQI